MDDTLSSSNDVGGFFGDDLIVAVQKILRTCARGAPDVCNLETITFYM